jgi:phosphoglycolate phosphatase
MRAAIFDLDGTLADSVADIAAALNRVLVEEGVAALDVAVVTGMVGAGARKLIERALIERAVAFDTERLDGLWVRFVERYDAYPCVHTRLYPGVREVLEGLRAEGWLLGVCTNKPQSTADLVIDELGVRGLFGTVVGGREGVPLKPAGDMVLQALADLGAEAGHAVMVGDSKADVGAARAAGMPVVLMSYGYTGGEPVAGMGADAVVDHFSELRVVMGGLCKG